MTIRIDHCVCTGCRFAALLEIAQAEGLSFEQLADRTGAARGCGLCRPYIRRMLRTGETIFHEIVPNDAPPDALDG